MAPTTRNRLVLLLASIVAAVGATDALISQEWDFLAVFALTLVLHLTLLAQLSRRRLPVEVRADLVHWLRKRSDETGESMETLTERAISSYRSVFVEDNNSPSR